jgi:protein-S-isoprenylcysteine O-methyltransferase Ste14
MAASACEIAVICAGQFISSPAAQKLLSFLIPVRTSSIHESLHAIEQIRTARIFLVGCILVNIGAGIRVSCFHTLGRLFTFEPAMRKDHKLVTTGPYALVRHPAYSGGYLMIIGIVLCHISSGSWLRESGAMENQIVKGLFSGWVISLAALFGATIARINKEDDALRVEFGKSWETWASNVKYRLFPGVY